MFVGIADLFNGIWKTHEDACTYSDECQTFPSFMAYLCKHRPPAASRFGIALKANQVSRFRVQGIDRLGGASQSWRNGVQWGDSRAHIGNTRVLQRDRSS